MLAKSLKIHFVSSFLQWYTAITLDKKSVGNPLEKSSNKNNASFGTQYLTKTLSVFPFKTNNKS